MAEIFYPLQIVERLFDSVKTQGFDVYVIYVKNGELKICVKGTVPRESISVAIIRFADICDGLTLKQWSNLDAKLRILRKEDRLCLPHPKHSHKKTVKNC